MALPPVEVRNIRIRTLGDRIGKTEAARRRSRLHIICLEQTDVSAKLDNVRPNDFRVVDTEEIDVKSSPSRFTLRPIAQRVVVRGCDTGKEEMIGIRGDITGETQRRRRIESGADGNEINECP